MSEIKILHLSDIHFKKSKDDQNKARRKDVRKKMIATVEAHLKDNAFPDFAAITGDIAFSGKGYEYEEAAIFFEELRSILPEKTIFLVVPGNHDVDRDAVDKFSPPYYVVKNNMIDEFLENNEQVKNKVNTKFNSFKTFLANLNSGLYKNEDDYFWVKNFKDKQVSFLGLNSCWASEGDEDRFNIALGYPQVMSALEKSGKMPNRVLLMHHPPFNWLKDMEYGKCRVELFNRCRLLLHGHDHSDKVSVFKDPSHSIICLGANASYTGEKEGFIGFQFIKVEFQERRVAVRIWPYILDARRNEFVPDRERWSTQKGKAYFDIETIEPSLKENRETRLSLQIPEGYRDWVKEFHSKMDIEQLDPNAEALNVSLPEIYIPLETANPYYEPEEGKSGSSRSILKVDSGAIAIWKEEDELKNPEFIDIEKLLMMKKCILLRGIAGMGKTTIIKHLAYTITLGTAHPYLSKYLPVIIFLKDLWPIFEEELVKRGLNINFESILRIYLETKMRQLTMERIEDYLSQGRGLFLLDGLDEVPPHLRPILVEIIAVFRFENKKNRFLLTSRPHGIDTMIKSYFGEYIHDIEPLDDQKIRKFISDWFRIVSGQARGLADQNTRDMIEDIKMHEHVTVFTQNPLLLTALCILYQDNKGIQAQRVELYYRIVRNMLYRRFRRTHDLEKASRVEDYLKLLAFYMQERNIKSIDIGAAKDVLRRIFPAGDMEPIEYRRHIDALFDDIEPRCGLLKRLSDGEIEFFHLTFQEFLAARHMVYMEIDYKKFLEKSWWEETILLYTGLVNLEWKEKANEVVKEILNRRAENAKSRHQLWMLGSKALRDIQVYKRDERIVDEARSKLNILIESDFDPEIRFEAGDILGYLGDSRIGSGKMVQVDKGQFIRGSVEGEDHGDDRPVRRIYIDGFMIGKYPVTNEEFREFVGDGGYNRKEFWDPEGWQWLKENNISEPRFWHDRKWNGSNFPVVGISWYEASAYAAWLSQKRSELYRLPYEAEWEKAARGTNGNAFPWGDRFRKEMCNSRESGLNRTSPVGIFPSGKSPWGCLDMAGNIWEWCEDWFGSDYYRKGPDKNPKGPSEGSNRVCRGGSWLSITTFCRTAFREYYEPVYRTNSLGFRIVRP